MEINTTADQYFNFGGDAAHDYERLKGHRVIIYYRDQRGTDRKLIGKIVDIDGDKLWLENHHKLTGELWPANSSTGPAGRWSTTRSTAT